MQYSDIVVPGVTAFVESAEPGDLQARIAQKFVELAALVGLENVPALYLFNLSAGGDGHTFVAELGVTTLANAPDGFAGPNFVCYQAADAEELPNARDNAVSAFGAGTFVDEQVVGAAQGTKFMGCALVNQAV